jgi:hypothetical protein
LPAPRRRLAEAGPFDRRPHAAPSMKFKKRFSSLVLLSAALSAVAAFARAPESAAAPARPLQGKDNEFQMKFKQALSINALDECARLVRQYQNETVNYVDILSDLLAQANSDTIEKEFQALMKSWKEVMKTSFVEKQYSYASELLATDATRRTERAKLKNAFNATLGRYTENINGKNSGMAFDQCAAEYAGQSRDFEALNDYYWAARCASAAGLCYDEPIRHAEADLAKACENYGRAVQLFEKVDLLYTYYQENKARWEKLVKDGYAAPPPSSDPGATPDPKVDPAAQPAVTTAMTFEALTGIDQFERPNYYTDDVYQIWPGVYMQAKGTSGQFASLEQSEKKGPVLLHSGAAQIGVDWDHNGQPDKTIPLTGNPLVVEVQIGDGETKRPWAFLCRTGIQDDTFQGLKTNLQPDDKQVVLYTINAGSVVGTIGGTKVRVLDDNMDGIYGSEPKLWNFRELATNTSQPDIDCVVIGDAKHARPWSRYQQIGTQWYELEGAKNGMELKATPVTLATGTLRLDYKGDQPLWLVVRGTNQLDKAFFDLMVDKKGIQVPSGTYQLFCGEIRQGKKAQVMKTLILPGPSTPKWTVTDGKETVVKLGAPYGFEFMTEVGDEKVTVKGKSVTIIGSAGERYDRTWNCAPRPEMSARKQGQKKGGKSEKMGAVLDLYETGEDGVQKYKFEDTFRPLDTSVPIKKGDTVEVQLIEKKNKLFGEIESIWR